MSDPKYGNPWKFHILRISGMFEYGHNWSRLVEVNLQCAAGLPGAVDLNTHFFLATIVSWSQLVEKYVNDNLRHFNSEPENFNFHIGYFKFLSMATLLKHPRGLSIEYQPTAIENDEFRDSRDFFLHGLILRRKGTCTSLPVLCAAIGRKLGWPIALALAKGHVLCKWVGEPSCINLEISGPGGGESYSDTHYHHWPHSLTQEEINSGHYLKPLTPHEETALFWETRGHCLFDNGRFVEAAVAYRTASELAPHWRRHAVWIERAEAMVQNHI